MKNLLNMLSSLPERVYIAIFIAIFLISSAYAYILSDDARILDQRIGQKQQELDKIIKLKDLYLAKKKSFDRTTSKSKQESVISLTLLEEVITKSFIGGKLNMLKQSTTKEEKGGSIEAFDVKVGGAALGEIITFIKSLEASGFFIKKLQLNMPAAGQTVIDMSATITGG